MARLRMTFVRGRIVTNNYKRSISKFSLSKVYLYLYIRSTRDYLYGSGNRCPSLVAGKTRTKHPSTLSWWSAYTGRNPPKLGPLATLHG